MISPMLLKKAMERKSLNSQTKEADGFNAAAFFSEIDSSLSYVELYFSGDPILLSRSGDEMFQESSVGHMEIPMSVYEMIEEAE